MSAEERKQATLQVPLLNQAERLHELITRKPQLSSGFNLIGYSQGGLLARIYLQVSAPLPARSAITVLHSQFEL